MIVTTSPAGRLAGASLMCKETEGFSPSLGHRIPAAVRPRHPRFDLGLVTRDSNPQRRPVTFFSSEVCMAVPLDPDWSDLGQSCLVGSLARPHALVR